MKKIKIMIITDYAAPYEGNFIESLKRLNEKLIEQKKEVIYFFSPKAKEKNCVKGLQDLGYKVYFGSENVIENMGIMKKIIKQEGVFVLYTHFCSLKTQLQVKLIRKLSSKLKLISHFHNHFAFYDGFLRKKIQFFSFNGDLNIGCSKSVMESLPYNPNKSIYINNGIDFERLNKYRKIQTDELKSKHIILMFGFDYYRKGVDVAIRALEGMNTENTVLAIALSKNKEIVEENIKKDFGKVPDFVTFLEPINDVATYYHMAEIFLTSSREEGLCYSVLEAAYCSAKIICSNISGVTTDIPGEFLFESENYEELRFKILEAYASSESKNQEMAIDFVIKNYSVDNWVKNIAECITNFVNKPRILMKEGSNSD